MLTVMPIVVVPCLVGGYWLPRCAGQCSRGKVAPNQAVVDSDGGGTKSRGSYWTKASRAGQSYYYRWQTAGLKVKESTLVLPKEAVLRTEERVELTAFETGLAEAERMDALRDAGQLNLESPWMQAVDDEGVFYWRDVDRIIDRDGPRSIVDSLPEDGAKGDSGWLRRENLPSTSTPEEVESDDY